jgi:hypothetical protein
MGRHGRSDRHLLTERPLPLALLGACLVLTVVGLTQFGGRLGSDDETVGVKNSVRPAATATTPAATPSPTATPTPTPTATPTPTRTTAAVFHWQVRKVKAAELGQTWRKGCPVRRSALRAVSVRYWGFDAEVHTGVLILHKSVAARTRPVFATMFKRKFPLRSVRPVSEFGGSDDISMAADNTSGFNCRRAVAAGPPSWSRHAYGKAIDVNPVENPYLFGKKVLPPAGRKFASRSRAKPGLIRRGDPIYRAFRAAGYRWGGAFSNPDYQHFDR